MLMSLLAILGLTTFLMNSSVMGWFRDFMAKIPLVGSFFSCSFAATAVSSVLVYLGQHLLGGVGEVACWVLGSSAVLHVFTQVKDAAVSFLTSPKINVSHS